MQFTAMSIWLFTGLAVLTAGVLAALQYLRIRPRRVRIITTLFWAQAADQARARTLLERFRHPRTYLLLLAASLLGLLALAKPVFDAAGQPQRVIVLEAGLAMTAADNRFDNALELVRAEAASLGEDRVAVITADPHPRLIKHFDESMAALEDRLTRIKTADRPVTRADILPVAKSMLAGRQGGQVVLVSAQPVTIGDPEVRVLPAGDTFGNAFILSAVFVPDPADLTRGAFHCRVGFTGKQAGSVTVKVTRADKVLREQTVDFKPGELKELNVPDIAADGAVLTASVTGDDAVLGDNRVDFQLPDRRRIQVVPVSGFILPPGLTSVLSSLPEVTTQTTEEANLPVVRVGPADSGADILIQQASSNGELRAVRTSAHPLVEGLVFEDSLCRVPARPLDLENNVLPLLLVSDSAIAAVNPAGNQFTIAGTVFDRDATLAGRTGYMVFWSKMLHHLAPEGLGDE